MDEYQTELQTGGIQFRDKWQFELKSELFPFSEEHANVLTQEFYIFIPNSLQINDQTYPKTQFYLDQTNLIRFKTPNFSLSELNDKDNAESPLVRVPLITHKGYSPESDEAMQNELKLLGDIFNSSIRDTLATFSARLGDIKAFEQRTLFIQDFYLFCDQLELFHKTFDEIQSQSLAAWTQPSMASHFQYIDEFFGMTTHDYLAGFLHRLRSKSIPEFQELDRRICGYLLAESTSWQREEKRDEYILYQKGLLNKFVIDPLLLKTNRASVDQRYRNFIGGIPAAVAMLLYLMLFIWQGNVFLLNSEPFILLTVIIYVLKDRLKEELRFISYRQAAKWFSDYTTEIHSNSTDLGTLRESMSFVQEETIDRDILGIRNREFHGVMETFKRPEQILYYKKKVSINKKPKIIESRFYGLSIIFRFDIHHFLNKAEDPFQSYFTLEPETLTLRKIQLPRVYHINIIMKTTHQGKGSSRSVSLEKYRLVVDKNGIKRIEVV